MSPESLETNSELKNFKDAIKILWDLPTLKRDLINLKNHDGKSIREIICCMG